MGKDFLSIFGRFVLTTFYRCQKLIHLSHLKFGILGAVVVAHWAELLLSAHTPTSYKIYFIFKTIYLLPVWPEKNHQMFIKVAQKWFHYKNDRFWHLYNKCLKMWANQLLPKALKSCPKSNKSPNLVTLPLTPWSVLRAKTWLKCQLNEWYKKTWWVKLLKNIIIGNLCRIVLLLFTKRIMLSSLINVGWSKSTDFGTNPFLGFCQQCDQMTRLVLVQYLAICENENSLNSIITFCQSQFNYS